MGRSDICRGAFGTSFHARRWLSLDLCGLICVNLSIGIHIFALTGKLVDCQDYAKSLG